MITMFGYRGKPSPPLAHDDANAAPLLSAGLISPARPFWFPSRRRGTHAGAGRACSAAPIHSTSRLYSCDALRNRLLLYR